MALLILLICLEPYGFASHSRADPLILNDMLHPQINRGNARRRLNDWTAARKVESVQGWPMLF